MDVRTPVPTNYGDWTSKWLQLWTTQAEQLKSKFGKALEEVKMPGTHTTDVPIFYISKERIIEVLEFVKTDPGFEYIFLSDLTCTDESPSEKRFEIVYNLFSHSKLNRVRLKVRVRENDEVPTAVGVWRGADWAEREVFDMYGVRFKGHPDLRRILMDHRWEGYPLRKDYPLRGYQIFPTAETIDPKLLD